MAGTDLHVGSRIVNQRIRDRPRSDEHLTPVGKTVALFVAEHVERTLGASLDLEVIAPLHEPRSARRRPGGRRGRPARHRARRAAPRPARQHAFTPAWLTGWTPRPDDELPGTRVGDSGLVPGEEPRNRRGASAVAARKPRAKRSHRHRDGPGNQACPRGPARRAQLAGVELAIDQSGDELQARRPGSSSASTSRPSSWPHDQGADHLRRRRLRPEPAPPARDALGAR